MPDVIELRGLRVMASHGVLSFEKESAQPFEIDVDLTVDMTVAEKSDRLDDTVSYADVVQLIAQTVGEESHYLLERVAGRICEELLADTRIFSVDLTIRKLRPPIPIDIASTGVRIRRP